MAVNGTQHLREWLSAEAGIHAKLLDKMVHLLEDSDVFVLQDLRVLRDAVGLQTVLKPVSAAKIAAALDRSTKGVGPSRHQGASLVRETALPPMAHRSLRRPEAFGAAAAAHAEMGAGKAAYVFALVGGCERHELAILAANELLQATNPVFPVVAMVTPNCSTVSSMQRLQRARITPISVSPVHLGDVNCSGSFRGPPAHFALTFTIFKAFTLTNYSAVLYLDADLAVMRNLDHLLVDLLRDKSGNAQIWTPQQMI